MPTEAELVADAQMYGSAIQVNPYRALLDEVNRTAGHIEWLHHRLQVTTHADELLDVVPGRSQDPVGRASGWLRLYQQERRHLVQVCSQAVKLGLSERLVDLEVEKAQMVHRALIGVLDRLGLTEEQRAMAPQLLRDQILELSRGATVDAHAVVRDELESETSDHDQEDEA